MKNKDLPLAKDHRKEYHVRLIDKYLESVNIYWSALITINGLLLTFFSIDVLSSGEKTALFNYLLIGACITSLWLLIWNFRTIKMNYYKIGKLTVEHLPDVPEDVRKTARTKEEMRQLIDKYTAQYRQEEVDRSASQQRFMIIRESIVEGLFVLETILVVLIIITRAKWGT
jgi:hypothetical protein